MMRQLQLVVSLNHHCLSSIGGFRPCSSPWAEVASVAAGEVSAVAAGDAAGDGSRRMAAEEVSEEDAGELGHRAKGAAEELGRRAMDPEEVDTAEEPWEPVRKAGDASGVVHRRAKGPEEVHMAKDAAGEVGHMAAAWVADRSQQDPEVQVRSRGQVHILGEVRRSHRMVMVVPLACEGSHSIRS